MKYNTNTKIIEYSVVCKSKINAQQVKITAFKLIDNFPTENPGLVLDKHTPNTTCTTTTFEGKSYTNATHNSPKDTVR